MKSNQTVQGILGVFFRFPGRSAARRSAARAFFSLLVVLAASLLNACTSTDSASQPEDPLQSRLTGMENSAVKSRTTYLVTVANEKKEQEAEEAAMAPNFNQGPGVIPSAAVH